MMLVKGLVNPYQLEGVLVRESQVVDLEVDRLSIISYEPIRVRDSYISYIIQKIDYA